MLVGKAEGFIQREVFVGVKMPYSHKLPINATNTIHGMLAFKTSFMNSVTQTNLQ